MTAERKKFRFTGKKMTDPFNQTLYEIEALVDIPEHGVKAGDAGGFIRTESNLSHEGAAWVGPNARVYDRARVEGNALVSGFAVVKDDALIKGEARVRDAARVLQNATVEGESHIMDSATIAGSAHIFDAALIKGFANVDTLARVFGSAVVDKDGYVSDTAMVFGEARVTDYATAAGDSRLLGATIAGDNAVIDSGSFNLSRHDPMLTDHQFPSLEHRLDPEHPRFEPELELERQKECEAQVNARRQTA